MPSINVHLDCRSRVIWSAILLRFALLRRRKEIFSDLLILLVSIVLHFIATYLIYTLHCSLNISPFIYPEWNYFLIDIWHWKFVTVPIVGAIYIKHSSSICTTTSTIHFSHRRSSALDVEKLVRLTFRHTHRKDEAYLSLYTGCVFDLCFSANICYQLKRKTFS